MWDEAKNVGLLERAAKRIRWPLFVAGEGGKGEVARNVTRLGRLTERQVAEQLARASIYVLPARYEPFGLSILEAALAGCALVVGDITSLREIWGDCAVYVSPDDADGLARSIG